MDIASFKCTYASWAEQRAHVVVLWWFFIHTYSFLSGLPSSRAHYKEREVGTSYKDNVFVLPCVSGVCRI